MWSKDNFGNIFQEIATLEDIIKIREKQFEENPSRVNRTKFFKAHVELNMHLNREEYFWRQDNGYEWFKDGERNTKFFHTIVKGRRRKLKINRIQNEQGE